MNFFDYLPLLALCMMRPLGVFLLLPIFTSAALGGALLRNTLVLMVALPVIPAYIDNPALTYVGNVYSFSLLIVVEIMLGAMIGFIAAIPFWAIDMAGFVVDTLRGSSMANVFNPMLNVQSSLFGMFFTHVLSVIFLVTGGFNRLIEAIYTSFVLVPPGGSVHLSSAFFPFCMQLWQVLFELCLSFAMPAIVIMLLIDLALGLINRSAKQPNVFFVAMPIKCLMILLLFAASLDFAFSDYILRINTLVVDIKKMMGLLL